MNHTSVANMLDVVGISLDCLVPEYGAYKTFAFHAYNRIAIV